MSGSAGTQGAIVDATTAAAARNARALVPENENKLRLTGRETTHCQTMEQPPCIIKKIARSSDLKNVAVRVWYIACKATGGCRGPITELIKKQILKAYWQYQYVPCRTVCTSSYGTDDTVHHRMYSTCHSILHGEWINCHLSCGRSSLKVAWRADIFSRVQYSTVVSCAQSLSRTIRRKGTVDTLE